MTNNTECQSRTDSIECQRAPWKIIIDEYYENLNFAQRFSIEMNLFDISISSIIFQEDEINEFVCVSEAYFCGIRCSIFLAKK